MSTEDKLRQRIRSIMSEAHVPEEHVTMVGGVVPFGCQECVDDIHFRITDAMMQRDRCARGSADRASLNGVLAMLRRLLRAANKQNI